MDNPVDWRLIQWVVWGLIQPLTEFCFLSVWSLFTINLWYTGPLNRSLIANRGPIRSEQKLCQKIITNELPSNMKRLANFASICHTRTDGNFGSPDSKKSMQEKVFGDLRGLGSRNLNPL